ncbi:MAG: adenylosuccinate lyase [Myxococcales bacterium]|nr:adenylosuccinate lyase [Myxococcales bacterium]
MSHDIYQNPLNTRYASREMSALWSEQRKHSTWRRLWVALAEAEQELGLDISDAQLDELRRHVDDINFDKAAAYEKELRHDVMAHVHHFGEVAGGDAAKIIHLGATSCFVADNAELVMIRDGLELIMDRLYTALDQLAAFARAQREQATLAFTHFQPAQLTTVGKRACLWAQDLALDLETIEALVARIPLRGVKGTTGTQASFLQLFDGDHAKVRELERRVAAAMGFERWLPVSGQTYTRKIDTWVVSALADVCGSAAKLAVDLRLLAHERELEEPFERKQIGSSAMAYKRNPMRSERICSLARFVHSLATSPRETHANQWLERTLDDSANRRLVLTEAFLATDAVLNLVVDVTAGLVVYPARIAANMADELPFMATEAVIMRGTRAGASRQDLHEAIRVHAWAAAGELKEGRPNDLMARMAADPALAPHVDPSALDPRGYVGRAPEQVDEYLADALGPLLERHRHRAGRFAARVRV